MKYIIQDFMTKTVIATVESSREGKIDKLTASPAVTKAWKNAPLTGGGTRDTLTIQQGKLVDVHANMKDTKKMDVWAFADHLSRLDSDGNVYVVKEDKR